ncbi:MAG: DUF1848 domain-containing protein [Desulfovibrionaceae bacterium]|nr:DUF1848 domain-containing protein [Desulfovibrionaceae bacterium]
MIISASRRTDIPAFYGEWFMNRLNAGEVLVRNPRAPRRVSRVPLSRSQVDCLVFWSKNPAPMRERLTWLHREGWPLYVQFTLTPYGADVEPGVPPRQCLLDSFRRLADALGPDRVVWRYDPVLLNATYPAARHTEDFDRLSRALAGYTRRCVFSFVDMYRRNRPFLRAVADGEPTQESLRVLAAELAALAAARGLSLAACAEDLDLSDCGVERAACIDRALIEQITGTPLRAGKDPGQRASCGCVESVDIGEYDSCPYACRYCYATSHSRRVAARVRLHNPASPLLVGWPDERDTIIDRRVRSRVTRQGSLLP